MLLPGRVVVEHPGRSEGVPFWSSCLDL